MIIDELYEASYKGAVFRIKSSSIDGGRKDIKHEFPNSDQQNIEDLGRKNRSYNITGFISEPNYTQKKNKLLSALEEGGTGLLVHPFFGNIENIAARNYSLVESISEVGEATFSMNFEVSGTDGLPSVDTSSKAIVAASNAALQSSLNSSIVDDYSIFFPSAFTDAKEMLERTKEYFDEKTKVVQQVTDTINAYSGLVSDYSSAIVSLVDRPQALADSISNIFQTANGLYASAESTVLVFRGFFGFDDDVTDPPNIVTASINERKNNRKIVKSYMQTASLGYAYQNIVDIDFDTVDDLLTAANILEAQFKKVSQTLGGDQLEALSDLRDDVQSVIDDLKLSINQVITVKTARMPARVLAFTYYGNDEYGEKIINLNDDSNVSFYEGDVKVLSV